MEDVISWQPIETAPRDREILIFARLGNPMTIEGRLIAEYRYTEDGIDWWYVEHAHMYAIGPMCWAELPEVPAS